MYLVQLPSGSWRTQKMMNGKRYQITFDHKPTKREMEQAFANKLKEAEVPTIKSTFKECAEEYIKSKENVLSVATVKGYKSIIRNLSPAFLATSLDHMTALLIQKEVNNYSVGRSAKTVKNASGFISVVVWQYLPDLHIKTKLPRATPSEVYIPTDEEVQKLKNEIKGTEYEAAILLCIMGLRKSEVLSVKADDIKKVDDGYILRINKAKVEDDEGKYIEQVTKTYSSTREIYIPSYLAKLIKKRGYAYKGFPGNILRNLHRYQDRLGIHRCKLHELRHYYVSMAHTLGVPDSYIAKAVGHKSTATTRAIYLHAQKDREKEMQEKAINFLDFK